MPVSLHFKSVGCVTWTTGLLILLIFLWTDAPSLIIPSNFASWVRSVDSHLLFRVSCLWVGGVLGVFAWEALNIDGPLSYYWQSGCKWESTVFLSRWPAARFTSHVGQSFVSARIHSFLGTAIVVSVAPNDPIRNGERAIWAQRLPLAPSEAN